MDESNLTNALFEAAQRLKEQQETRPDQVLRRLSADEREANLRRSKELSILESGLQRLREGRLPTSTQAPYVAKYISGYEDRLRDYENRLNTLRTQVQQSATDTEIEREFSSRVAQEWNETVAVLEELGIRLFYSASWHWEGRCHGNQVHNDEGYASAALALKAALMWRIAQG